MSENAHRTTTEIRRILQPFYTTHPEAASALEDLLLQLERTIEQLSAEDPFRAFVLTLGSTNERATVLLERLEASALKDLAKAEKDKQARLLLDAQNKAGGQRTLREFVTQPGVAIALVSLLGNAVFIAYALLSGTPLPSEVLTP